jgi:hypothetical protein
MNVPVFHDYIAQIEDVIEAAAATVPLSVARREDIARIRAMAAGRFTPVR